MKSVLDQTTSSLTRNDTDGGSADVAGVGGHRRYAAFISYSHADMKVARWLHRAIETYRIPAGVESPADGVPLPTRLRPVFRDEDELPGASELGPKLEAALRDARALIVICSPRAARSEWVDKEIRTFKTLHPDAPVLPVIASGVPGSTDAECFPEALRWMVLPDGTLDRSRPVEPLAPDLQKLDRRAVKLKLVAALLDVPYSALNDREQHRRRRITALLGTLALAIIAMLSTLTVVALRERDQAEAARQIAIRERNDAIAARNLAERRTWLAQQAASQIRNFADDANCDAPR